jgi:hypothetical protein
MYGEYIEGMKFIRQDYPPESELQWEERIFVNRYIPYGDVPILSSDGEKCWLSKFYNTGVFESCMEFEPEYVSGVPSGELLSCAELCGLSDEEVNLLFFTLFKFRDGSGVYCPLEFALMEHADSNYTKKVNTLSDAKKITKEIKNILKKIEIGEREDCEIKPLLLHIVKSWLYDNSIIWR